MGRSFIATAVILCCTEWLSGFRKEKSIRRQRDRILVYGLTFVSVLVITGREYRGEWTYSEAAGSLRNGIRILSGAFLAGGLTAAAYMDNRDCWVYNYVWWWCLPWAAILGLTEDGEGKNVIAVLLFIGLQQLFFSKLYGRADCHAFSVCALAECGNRAGMLFYLEHMLSAVLLLALVQLIAGNVSRSGRLRTPQPFIPYITASFWGILLWEHILSQTYIYT